MANTNQGNRGKEPEKVKIPEGVSALDQSRTTLKNDSGALADCFLVTLTGKAGMTVSFTVHHPIGITDLDEDDWVQTRTSEVRSLVSRSVDPEQGKVNSVRQKWRNEFLIKMGYLVSYEGTTVYPKDLPKWGGCSRAETLAWFDDQVKILKRAEREAFDKEHPPAKTGKARQPVFQSKISREQVYDENLLAFEKLLNQVLSNRVVVAEMKSVCPQHFRTLGGPAEDQEQRAVKFLKGLSHSRAYDTYVKRLYKLDFTDDDMSQKVKDTPQVHAPERYSAGMWIKHSANHEPKSIWADEADDFKVSSASLSSSKKKEEVFSLDEANRQLNARNVALGDSLPLPVSLLSSAGAEGKGENLSVGSGASDKTSRSRTSEGTKGTLGTLREKFLPKVDDAKKPT
jgi:hypothetical protein